MALNIVFMGTPDFASTCLQRLLDDGHRVAAVLCQPDRPKGRGYKLVPPPVKALAEERGIPVHQPVKMRDGTVRALLEEIRPDVAVVVAYGRMLPPDILAVPRLGCVNIHASLLPKLRGAAPIQWAVLNGEETTGVCSMFMAEGMDTGDVILTRETPIGPEETSGQLFERLSLLGADCLSETMALLEGGEVPRHPQDEALATYAPSIQKEMAAIDFSKTAREICCLVRGMHPSPCAFLTVEGKRLKVHKAAPAADSRGEPGVLLDAKRFVVGCGDGAVELLFVQPEGKKPMEGGDYIRGRRMAPGQKLTAD